MTCALLLAGGCDVVLGLDEFRGGQAGGGTAASGTGGTSGDCNASGQCVNAPPPGWEGPIALSDHVAAGTMCSPSYPQLVVEGISDIEAEPAECSCDCDLPKGVNCPAPRLHMSSTPTCPKLGSGLVLNNNTTCHNTFSPPATNTMTVLIDPGVPTVGSCEAMPGVTLPPASNQTRIACSAAPLQATGCAAGQLCAPAPNDELMPRYCIYTPGDAPCPSALGYAEKYLLYGGALIDDRGCSPCTCSDPMGSACTGSSTVYSSANCTQTKLDVTHDDQCYTLPSAGVAGVRRNSASVISGSCTPMGGQPQGEVTAPDPHTICCTPEIN